MDKKNPGSFIKGVVDAGSKAVTGAINDVGKAATGAVKKVGEIRPTMPQISVEDVLRQTLKIPLVRIDRDKFLKKELSKICTEDVVALAIARNPAYAGIDRSTMDKIAQQAITYETNTATATSFAAGLPGGFAMAATIPADITQYFSHILRVMQKLAYCYGFDNFNLTDEEIDEETLNQIMTFLGVMFGVSGANQGVRALAEVAAKKVSRSLAQKALTKGTIYPIVKKVATSVGIRMTKQVFANGVSKAVPVVGGVVAGGLTLATFLPNCNRLKKSFQELPLCDPGFYDHNDG